jgi:hypothetical protein
MAKYWMGKPPGVCDICVAPLGTSFVDGRTNIMGRWGCLCPRCHVKYGCGFGTGHGQRYERQEDGQWLKTAG